MIPKPGNEGSASGGGSWAVYAIPAMVGSVGLMDIMWKTFQSKKKKEEELDVQVQDNQGYINLMKVKELENLLVDRQHRFCSPFISQDYRKQLEDQIMQKAKDLVDLVPDIQPRLLRIFSEDCSCGFPLIYILTGDKTQNGRLMWDELEDWRRRARNGQKP